MTLRSISARLAIVLALPLLTSCSYTFEVRAVAIDGFVAFIVAPGFRVRSNCVTTVFVETDGPDALPAPGDHAELVTNGVYRWQSVDHADSCKNPFPVFYSRSLKGRRLVYSNVIGGPDAGREAAFVAPKPLRIGVVYEVAITAGATGYGGGRFRLRPGRIIENLPL